MMLPTSINGVEYSTDSTWIMSYHENEFFEFLTAHTKKIKYEMDVHLLYIILQFSIFLSKSSEILLLNFMVKQVIRV